ncbi:MAG: hypothetical protein ACK48U_09250 [Planctomyces sp.]
MTTRLATEVAPSAQSALLAQVERPSVAIFGIARLSLQRPAFCERRAAAAAVSVVWRPASGEPPADTAGPDNNAGYRYAACKGPRNPSSDKHAAEIWIFDAGALNLCYAHSIPREVLLSRDPPDRLLYGRSGIFD